MKALTEEIKIKLIEKFEYHRIKRGAIPGLEDGIEAYHIIMSAPSLLNGTVSKDEAFKNAYSSFYKLYQGCRLTKEKSHKCQEEYFEYFDEVIEKFHYKNALPDYDYLVDELFLHTSFNKAQYSFASKMIHTLSPNKPIFDSIVGTKHFGIRLPVNYAKYEKEFNAYLNSEDGRWIVSKFKELYPQVLKYHISDTKILDYALWIDRKSSLHGQIL